MALTGSIRRAYRAPALELRGREFEWGTRTYLMGIINVTPDSFSGDGLGGDIEAAVAMARGCEAAEADILDIGAESSRPGAMELGPGEELARLLPALRAVRAATDLPISVDTCHASVAKAAIEAGADAVNDISGLREDPEMAKVVAEAGVALFGMHNQRGRPFRDVVGDIRAGFAETLQIAKSAGIAATQIVLDPGFGFGWTPEQNLEMLRRLPELWDVEYPLLIGTSRKSTLGFVAGGNVDDRLDATAASVALSIAGGADIVRVHDVAAMARAARLADAVVRGNWRHRE